jgi:pimeloyl-ACP methyl ester carboxylesterase
MRSLLLLLLSVLALLPAAEGGKPAYEVIDWSKAAKGLPGDTKGELKHPVKNSSVMRWHIYAPAALPDKPILGLILGFHGTNGTEDTMSGQAHESFAESGLADGYVIAAGKSLGTGWTAGDEAAVLQFVDWLQTVYPIDKRRMFIWGHSNGGWMTSWFGSRHADRFAGLVRFSGYGQDVPDKAGMGLEYYLVHGDNDAAVKVDQSRALRDRLIHGFHYVYREIKGADHSSFFAIKPLRDDAARWIDGLRHKTVAPTESERAWLKGVVTDRAGEPLAKPETWAELVRIGGPLAWQVAGRAAKAKEPAVRLALAQACAHVRFDDDEAVAALTKLSDDADADVRTAAIAALAVHANWRDQTAQTTLVKLAMNKKRSAEDRLSATTGLAHDLALPMLGTWTDDPALFEGAVTLLDSDVDDIRTTIFAPLKPAVVDGLGYDPLAAAPARKAPIEAWRTWFNVRSTTNGKAVAGK